MLHAAYNNRNSNYMINAAYVAVDGRPSSLSLMFYTWDKSYVYARIKHKKPALQ